MPPKFIFIRHGEGHHNVAYHTYGKDALLSDEYKDARLTEKGRIQARETGRMLNSLNLKFTDLWSSPLTRCLETSQEIFEEINVRHLYVHDNLLERLGGGHVCNDRRIKDKIKEEFPIWNYMFLPDSGPYCIERETFDSLYFRMLMFVYLLKKLYSNLSDEYHIVIVAHCDCINAITGNSLKNAEFVIVSFDDIENRYEQVRSRNTRVSSEGQQQQGQEQEQQEH